MAAKEPNNENKVNLEEQELQKVSKKAAAQKEKKEDNFEHTNTSEEIKPEVCDEITALRDELEKQKDMLLRVAAEFDNYKKRTERERAATAEYVKANVIKTLLPVIDNACRAADSGFEGPEFAKGAELIIKQLLESVSNLGMTETAAVGDTFDPEFHEAVMHVTDEEKPENCIVEVLQKGYKLNGTVIRPAMVKVAN